MATNATAPFLCAKCGGTHARRERDEIGYTLTCSQCGLVTYLSASGQPMDAVQLPPPPEVPATAPVSNDVGLDEIDWFGDGDEQEVQEMVTVAPPVPNVPEIAVNGAQEKLTAGTPSDDGTGDARPVPKADRERLGICTACGLEPARDGRKMGEDCAAKARADWHRRQQEKKRSQQAREQLAPSGPTSAPIESEVKLTYSALGIAVDYLKKLAGCYGDMHQVCRPDDSLFLVQASAVSLVASIMDGDDDRGIGSDAGLKGGVTYTSEQITQAVLDSEYALHGRLVSAIESRPPSDDVERDVLMVKKLKIQMAAISLAKLAVPDPEGSEADRMMVTLLREMDAGAGSKAAVPVAA